MIRRSRFSILDSSPRDNERGLIGWWPFDDGKVTDFSGNQNNAYIGVGATNPTFASSEIGNSYGFVATKFFEVTNLGNSNPISTNAFTVATWLKPNVLTRGDIISVWESDGAGSDQFVLLYGLTSGKPQLFVFTGSAQNSGVGATAMAVGNWYHVAGTWDGTTVAVYLDGVFQASNAPGGTIGNGSSQLFVIGASGAGGANGLNGSLADPRIYNRALSRQEINDLYSRGVPRFELSPDEWEMPALFSNVPSNRVNVVSSTMRF